VFVSRTHPISLAFILICVALLVGVTWSAWRGRALKRTIRAANALGTEGEVADA
jgi:hypothetical protein